MTHIFAIYYSDTSSIVQKIKLNGEFNLTEEDLIYRINNILRLNKQENIILFDREYNISCQIIEIAKRSINLKINKIDQNTNQEPEIIWLLPILKRDAFEEALYSLCELGVNKIQPIITQKIHVKNWGNSKDISRAGKIIIAAAEQSKNYKFPELLPVLDLSQAINNISNLNLDSKKIFFEPTGRNFLDILKDIESNKTKNIIALAGPEGDLTDSEKEILRQNNFQFCKLTSTILRAQEAVTIGLGILRSLIKS